MVAMDTATQPERYETPLRRIHLIFARACTAPRAAACTRIRSAVSRIVPLTTHCAVLSRLTTGS